MRRPRRVAAWSSVAVVVALVAVGAVLGAYGARTAAAPPQGPTETTTHARTTTTTTTSTAPPVSTANNGTSEASELLSEAPVPSGATVLGVAPPHTLAHPPTPVEVPTANRFDAYRIFSVPAAPSALMAYLRAHLRTGWSDNVPTPAPPPRGANLLVRVPGHGVHFQVGVLSYEAIPTSGGAELRVDAEVTWNPSRSSDESVPPRGPVVVTGYATSSLSQAPSGPTAVTVSGPEAVSFRQDFNALALAAPTQCIESTTFYTLRFPGQTGSPTVSASRAGCAGQLFVTSGGTQMAPLLGDCQLLQAVAAVLPEDKAAFTHHQAAQCSPSVPVGP